MIKGIRKIRSQWVLGLLLATFFSTAAAQAVATAEKKAEVSVFAGVARLATSYNDTSQVAGIAGLDYTRFIRRLYVAPSLELRGSFSPRGAAVGEEVFAAGLKVDHRYHRFRPYADFLFGVGTVRFNQIAPSDDSIVYTYGGGVDMQVAPNLAVKFDAQASHWHLGVDDTRTPSLVSLGVVYYVPAHFRFRK